MPLPAQDPLVAFAPAPHVPPEVLATLCTRDPLVPDPPGPTGIRRDNPRHQGEIGLSDAIGWFGRRGLTVSIPLAGLVDILFVLTDDGDRHVIPAGAVQARRAISLGDRWQPYRAPAPRTGLPPGGA